MSVKTKITTFLHSSIRAAILIIIFSASILYPQTNPQWIVYTIQNSGLPHNSVGSIIIDKDNVKWIGTGNGLAKFDGISWFVYDSTNTPFHTNYLDPKAFDSNNNIWIGVYNEGLAKYNRQQWVLFDTNNSGIPSNGITKVNIDIHGIKWIGTGNKGLAKFNDTNWIVYNTANSGIASNTVYAMTIDTNNVKWIGTFMEGYARFDDTSWTVYNSTNTGQPINFVRAMTVDYLNNIWIGTQFYGLVKFNYYLNQWTVYNSTNSGLPDNNLFSVYSVNHTKYIGTSSGIAIYNDTTWTVYNTYNSPLPSPTIHFVIVDKYNNVWIATAGGLAIYNSNGIIGINNNHIFMPTEFELFQNYPNPFNPITNIVFEISKTEHIKIEIYDVNGKLVEVPKDEMVRPGKYSVIWDGSKYSSGIYFYRMITDNKIISRKMILLK